MQNKTIQVNCIYLEVEEIRIKMSQPIERAVMLTKASKYLIQPGHTYANTLEEILYLY